MNYLSSNIRYLRRKNGHNQAELALNFGKKQNTVGNWENGVSEPSIKELVALSQIFMVGMEDLVNRDLELRDNQGGMEGRNSKMSEVPRDPGPADLPLSSQDKEMDGFWLTLRELRSLNQKLDILLGHRGTLDSRSSI
ncbi:MAG: helix-turn-helix transcriptional regulator [Chitinophagales bacterium]